MLSPLCSATATVTPPSPPVVLTWHGGGKLNGVHESDGLETPWLIPFLSCSFSNPGSVGGAAGAVPVVEVAQVNGSGCTWSPPLVCHLQLPRISQPCS